MRRRILPILPLAALIPLAFLLAACPIASSDSTRSVRDIIRDSDTAMAGARSFQVDATLGFDVNVLPSVGHVTAHEDVVKPNWYFRAKAGSAETEELVSNGQAYSRSDSTAAWEDDGAAPTAGPASAYVQTAELLALEAFGDFSSLPSDRSGTELLRYTVKVDRIYQLETTVLGIIVPDAKGVFSFVDAKGNIDFNFYIDSTTHLIQEVVIDGKVSAIDIPVNITGSIKYDDYNGTDITLPSPLPDASGGASARMIGAAGA